MAINTVRKLQPGENPKGKTTCGFCGWSWDDDIVTDLTPAPSGRCPFEYEHPSVTERADRIKEEVLVLIAEGTIPESVSSFSELHDYLDANELGGFCDEDDTTDELFGSVEDYHGYVDSVQWEVDEWLKGGSHRSEESGAPSLRAHELTVTEIHNGWEVRVEEAEYSLTFDGQADQRRWVACWHNGTPTGDLNSDPCPASALVRTFGSCPYPEAAAAAKALLTAYYNALNAFHQSLA